MELKQARSLVGCEAHIIWKDRNGNELAKLLSVFDAGFVPLYGACLTTEEGHIQLDRILSCTPTQAAA